MTPSIPLAWLGTYLVHSTLLLGVVWAASRLLRRRSADASLALEEGLWKAALVGGVLTATLQVGLGLLAPAPASVSVPPGAQVPVGVSAAATDLAPAPSVASALGPEATARPHQLLAQPAARLPGWQRLALGVWLLGALGGIALLGTSWLRFGRAVRPRHEVTSGPPRRLLDRLVAASRTCRPVRLTGAERLPVPVALGVVGREICVPRRALDGFGPRRQEALLAHELAHLERRDPAWLLACGVIESVLFFQPLNRLARARLQEIAEYRCDTWAVERTGDRIGLARCLTEVAGWLTGARAVPTPGMASRRTALGQRVHRILEGGPGDTGRSRRWVLPLSAALLLTVAGFAPGVAPTPPEAPAARPDAPTTAPSAPSAQATDPAPPPETAPSAPVNAPEEPHAPPPARAPEAVRASAQVPEGARSGDDERAWVEDSEREWWPRPEGDLDPELQAEIAEIERLAAEIARTAVPDPEALEALSAEAARIAERAAVIDGEAMARLQEELARELEILDHDGVHELSPEERERLETEMERIGEEIRIQAEQARPGEEELERLREMADRVRPDEEELTRMQQELESRARSLEQRVREEHRRELEERREKLRERMEEIEERTGTEMEERRQELEEHRTELEQRRRALEEQRRGLEEEEGES